MICIYVYSVTKAEHINQHTEHRHSPEDHSYSYNEANISDLIRYRNFWMSLPQNCTVGTLVFHVKHRSKNRHRK